MLIFGGTVQWKRVRNFARDGKGNVIIVIFELIWIEDVRNFDENLRFQCQMVCQNAGRRYHCVREYETILPSSFGRARIPI